MVALTPEQYIGSGKTILISTILEQLLIGYSESKNKSAVLYFFFDFNDVEKRRHENMVRSMASQLLMHQGSSDSRELQSLYSSCLFGERQPTCDALLVTLRQMMSAFKEIFIIVDALDECTERPELLAVIEEIFEWNETNMHILTSSRRERAIEASMELMTAEEERINLLSTLVNPDIRTYIRHRLQSDQKLKRWRKDPSIQLEVESVLMSKADGMYDAYTAPPYLGQHNYAHLVLGFDG